jgi:L-aminopeptidase/D-esterase-like protein
MISFTTASAAANDPDQRHPTPIALLANADIDPLFKGVVEATEEAIVNALVAARTMTGADGHTFYAIPHDRLRELLRHYGRLQ